MITEQFQPYITPRRLPDRAEIARQHTLEGQTYQQIADRYGVSRQAVGKEMVKWKREQKVVEAEDAD